LVNKKRILVVGSGDDSELDASSFDLVYSANSSFSRLANIKSIALVLSDAMLFSPKILSKHDPIPGMDKLASYKFRLKKYAIIDNQFFERLFVVDNKYIDIESALKRKNVTYNSLKKLNYEDVWHLVNFCFNYHELITIFNHVPGIKNKLRFLVQRLLNKKMHKSFRPSTGIKAIMLALSENPDADIYISGINIYTDKLVRKATYSSGEIAYQNNTHLLDLLYGKLLAKKNVRLHNNSGRD